MLSRVELNVVDDTLKQSFKRNEDSSDPWLKAAAQKLNSIISNQDIFSADVTYHKKCYDRFTYVNKYEKGDKHDEKSSILTAEREFITVLKRKIVLQKFCYLLKDLVGEMNSFYDFFDCGRESSAKSLKKLIIPVDYALASIVGCGLRDSEITLAFAQMVHRKLKANETKQEFPIFP